MKMEWDDLVDVEVKIKETAAHLKLSADVRVLSALSDVFRFRPDGYWRSDKYVLFQQTGGKQGWDGYIRPLTIAKSLGGGHVGTLLRGRCAEVLNACAEMGWRVDRSGMLPRPFADLVLEDIPDDLITAPFELDENQKLCILKWLQEGMGMNWCTVSSGKTAMFAAAASAIKRKYPAARFLYLCPTERLVKQVYSEVKKFLPDWDISQYGGGKQNKDGADMVVATGAMLNTHFGELLLERWFRTFMGILADECFVAGTPARLASGDVPIEQVKPGDMAVSYDHQAAKQRHRRVARVFKSVPKALVKVTLADGRVHVCTPAHPFGDGMGYTPAFLLRSGDMVLRITQHEQDTHLQPMRSNRAEDRTLLSLESASVRPVQSGAASSTAEDGNRAVQRLPGSGRSLQRDHSALPIVSRSPEGWSLLQPCLPQPNAVSSVSRPHGDHQPEARLCTNEGEEPNAVGGYPREDEGDVACERDMPGYTGRQRSASARPPEDAGLGAGVAHRARGSDGQDEGQRVAEPLQAGHRRNELAHRDRGGRSVALPLESTGSGQTEGRVPALVRVASVEVLEPGSDGRFGGLCPDGHVYNFEVEDDHNYFANGVLVHNCHHITSNSWKRVVLAIPAFFRLGASDTSKADDEAGRNEMRGLIGPILHLIRAEPLITEGRVAKPHIAVVDYNSWNGAFADVPQLPVAGSPAWALVDSEWFSGTYLGPVMSLDENGDPKVVKGKEVQKQGLHLLEINGEEHEMPSRWCLLERVYDRAVIRNKERNAAVTAWAAYYANRGLRTLVVCTRTLHVLMLEQLIGDAIGKDRVRSLFSEHSPKQRDECFEWLRKNKGVVLISPLVKEGVSINEVQSGVIADHVVSYEVCNQLIGRFIRKKTADIGENKAEIVLFIDRQHPRLKKNSLSLVKSLMDIRGYAFKWPCLEPGTEKTAREFTAADLS